MGSHGPCLWGKEMGCSMGQHCLGLSQPHTRIIHLSTMSPAPWLHPHTPSCSQGAPVPASVSASGTSVHIGSQHWTRDTWGQESAGLEQARQGHPAAGRGPAVKFRLLLRSLLCRHCLLPTLQSPLDQSPTSRRPSTAFLSPHAATRGWGTPWAHPSRTPALCPAPVPLNAVPMGWRGNTERSPSPDPGPAVPG